MLFDPDEVPEELLEYFEVAPTDQMADVWTLGPAPVDYDFCLACGFFGRGPTRPARFCLTCQKYARRCTCSRPDNDREPDHILTCPSCGSTDQWVDHYAAFVPEIPRRCILAGTSERGVCPACLAPWRRVVERGDMPAPGKQGSHYANGVQASEGNWPSGTPVHSGLQRDTWVSRQTTGWTPTCTCDAGPPIPATVLDPFAGTGTTLLVADRLGRDAIGIELSPRYAALCRARLSGDSPLFADAEDVPDPDEPHLSPGARAQVQAALDALPPDEPIADSAGVVHATLPMFEVDP